jgi:hypothetical protein
MKLAVPIIVLACCYVSFFGYIASSYNELPVRVASHFGIDGKPNGWMSRDACIAFNAGIAVIVPVIIIGTMAGAGKIPVSFINLPHKEYWLAPERRKDALATLLRFSLWLAILTVLLLTAMHWMMVRANTPNAKGQLDTGTFWMVFGGFLAATISWIVLLVRHFSKIA